MITGKIDVTKIDKSKLFEGKKGKYLDIVLIDTPNSEYGDFMIVQGTSKEEREKGVKGAILGNAKVIQSRKQDSKQTKPKPEVQGDQPADDSSIPF